MFSRKHVEQEIKMKGKNYGKYWFVFNGGVGIAIVIESSRGCSDILAFDKEYNRTLRKADDMLQEMQKQANNTPKNNK